ncbi:predicted protein [Sclerotinia sclerotiorum 1980 UF-70]|uniref:Uncharacterized protein n=2 Tax=Sclerotinia sclerotiorum (strain ATCC 18683 / 1980 / Ss-1) TaxID=665079 RepID=A7F8L8_SCLS1|nr:predicted protein [Sclerotinia sclerotiorum 1980 UF-70]APA13848.1 hypothetical protein sscle_11g086180 [Sclerotinia sclerotiorum 1980 UF-70]EDN99089.1 predicted protein [Sclerotinia sclerotiorum 1980 UF-70]
MSSSNLTTPCPAMLSNFFLTTPNDEDTETNFAQTKEPFDITSYSELDDPEDNVEIDTTKNNPSDPANNNFQNQSQFQAPEPAESFTSHHASTSSEFSDPTTDDLIQYAFDTALFAVNPESHHEHFLATPNQEMEDLARLRLVITRKPVVLGGMRDRIFSAIDILVRDFGAEVARPMTGIDVMVLLLSAGMKVKDFVTRLQLQLKVPFAGAFSAPAGMKIWDFEALSSTVRDRVSLAGTNLEIEDFPEFVISPIFEQDEFKPFNGFHPVDRFQSVDDYQNLNEFQPQSFTSPRKHTQASSLGNISNKPLITKSSPLELLNHALYKNYLNIIHGEKPEWDISSSVAEELFRPSCDEELSFMQEEQQKNNTLEPPPAPRLGNLSKPDFSEMSLDLDLQDDVRSLFRVPSRCAKKSEGLSSLKSSTREAMNQRFIIDTSAMAKNSKSSSIQSIDAPPSPITLSERLEPRIFSLLLTLHSLNTSPHHAPEIAHHININTNTNSNLDIWPTIALALDIPILPSHLLTSYSLQALGTFFKLVELEEGYLSDELHQWALKQHRIFIWINSDALEDGIDGVIEEPGICSQGEGMNEESDGEDSEDSKLWDYEDVEAFARREIVNFRRNLEWIQDVDVDLDVKGEEGTIFTLPDEVYYFCGDEDIIHRSASELVEESEGCSAVLEGYYKIKRNAR